MADYLLTKKGDWKGFLDLARAGAFPADEFIKKMLIYYEQSIIEIERLAQNKTHHASFFMGLSVWGDGYTDTFIRYCVPSLLAQNFPDWSVLLIHASNESLARLKTEPVIEALAAKGLSVWTVALDDGVLAHIKDNPNNKYWHLGMTQSIHLAYAKMLCASYHLLMPDVFYCEGYFERMLALKKPVITASNLNVVSETAKPALDEYREGLAIKIGAGDLSLLAMNNLHKRLARYFVREPDLFPVGHLLIYEGKDAILFNSPHQTLAFMSFETLKRVPDRFFMTLDSELDKLIPSDVPVYCPNRDDGLVMVEMSGADGDHPFRATSNLKEWCTAWHARVNSKALLKLFSQDIVMPLTPSDRPHLSNIKIYEMKERSKQWLKKYLP